MELKIVNEDDRELWDTLVEKSPHGTIFHTWRLLNIVKKHTKNKFYPIIGFKGTTPIGVYPLFFQKRFFLKMVFSPPPHAAVPYLGPAFVDYDKLKQSKKESLFIEFQKSVNDFISSELGGDYTHISVSPALMDSRPLKWTGYKIKPRYSYMIDLSIGMDALWKNITKNLRNDINRAKREGVHVECGLKNEMFDIYDLLVRRYAEQGKMVNVSREYLQEIYETLYPENLGITVVKHNGELVTGGIHLYYKDRAYFWIGNPKPYCELTNTNELLTWESIKNASEKGYKYYEIIGIATTEGLHRHYSKLNPNFSAYYSAVKRSFLSGITESVYVNILKPMKSKLYLKNDN